MGSRPRHHERTLSGLANRRLSSLGSVEARRLDVIEFCAIARAINVDPVDLFRVVVERMPERVER